MTIHLQNSKTKALFVAPNTWTDDPRSATAFKTTIDALNYKEQEHLDEVQILLNFGARALDLVISLEARP
jgi:hypothetical protein